MAKIGFHRRLGAKGTARGAMPVSRVKRAETTSSIGTGVLGAGIALLFPTRFQAFALPILAIGLVMHVWGMYDKHRLESVGRTTRLWWAELLYWFCWLTLGAVLLYLLLRRT